MSEEMVHPIFKTEHRDIWYLTSNDQDYLSKEELERFLEFWDDVLDGEKLCFGFNIDAVEKVKISIC